MKLSIQLLQSLSDTEGLLKSLTSMVVDDNGISSSAIADVLKFLRLPLSFKEDHGMLQFSA